MARISGSSFTSLPIQRAYLECFMDESWLEHLRQHERASVADREILDRAKSVHGRRRIDQIHSLARPSGELIAGVALFCRHNRCSPRRYA